MYKTIKKTIDFRSVHSLNYGYSTKFMRVKIKKNPEAITRVGYSVSKKIGSAVTRNLVKRRLKNIIGEFKLKDGWDIVIVARESIKNSSYNDLSEDLQRVCNKLELIEKP